MITIQVCVGSSCYLRGSDKIAETFEKLIAQDDLKGQVELAGSLCMDACAMGVSVRVGDRVYHELTPEKAEEFFNNEVRSKMRKT